MVGYGDTVNLIKILGVLAAVLVAFVVVGWLAQRRLIYLPGGDPGPPPAGWSEASLDTADGLALRAWLAEPAPDLDCDQVVIVFPGNAGSRADRVALGEGLVAAGFTVLLVDYRGYGGNPGSPSEAGLLDDARAARAFVDEAGLGGGSVVYFGESLGSGVAVGLAAEAPPDAMVLRSPFTSLADAARHNLRWLPVQWLLRDRFPSLERAPGLRGVPALVIAGTADRTVPIDQSRRLAEAMSGEFLVVEGADHNDFALVADPALVGSVAGFLDCSP